MGADVAPILVFGLSGQVGRALLGLAPSALRLSAVSRQPRRDSAAVRWHAGSLEQPPALASDFNTVLSLGPLDAFAAWFAASASRPRRVIALGSTSVHSRRDSPDPADRVLAAKLREAEQQLAHACAQRGVALQLLRPTLLWGDGVDDGLSRLVTTARRRGLVLLPGHARGLRQPVHVADIATAVLSLLESDRQDDFMLDLPGGETLACDQMLRRVLVAAAPGVRILRVPAGLSRGLARLVLWTGALGAGSGGQLLRMERDQVFDGGIAAARIGWMPRGFQPVASDVIR